MKKGFLAGVLTTLLVMCMVGSASATVAKVQKEIEYRDIKVSLDGEVLDLRDAKGNVVEPFMFGGTNYIPARALAEALGLEVAWDSANATVVLTHPKETTPTYITRTGSKYHNDPHCNGGTYWEVPYSTAIGMGLTPCEKCVKSTSISTQTTETTDDVLLSSKDHIRFYYTGLVQRSDGGCDFKIRCENDSDYKISARVRDFTINGNVLSNRGVQVAYFDCVVDPGRSLDTVVSVSKEALDDLGVSEVKRFKTGFSGYDTALSGWSFEVGGETVTVK